MCPAKKSEIIPCFKFFQEFFFYEETIFVKKVRKNKIIIKKI